MLATIGYENSSLSDFVATLCTLKVNVLADVRERAQSRRPGFSKTALSAALHEAGIAYIHFPELGDPKDGRDAARSGNYKLFVDIFSKQIAKPAAQIALTEIEKLVLNNQVCLMCYERDVNHCHRKIIAQQLEVRLDIKAQHCGVVVGSGHDSRRRVFYSDQSAATSI